MALGDYEHEVRVWEQEVKDKAAALVRNGYPPLQAMELARNDVQRERREQALQRRRDVA